MGWLVTTARGSVSWIFPGEARVTRTPYAVDVGATPSGTVAPSLGSRLEALDQLLSMLHRRAADGIVSRSCVTEALEAVELPARLYHEAMVEIGQAGLVIVDDPAEAWDAHADTGEDVAGWDQDGLSVFMQRTRHEVLTAAEEVELGRRIERGRLAAEALRQASSLGPEIKGDLLAQVRDGHEARQSFAASNMRLVIRLAANHRRHCSPALEFDDLIQEGYLGLTRAIEKWDCTRGLKFSTYATWWIRQSIARAIADKAATIRLPVHAHETLVRILRSEQQMAAAGVAPSIRRIAKQVQLPEAKVRELLSWRARIDSLHRLVGAGDVELHELLADDDASQPEAEAEHALLRAAIQSVVAELTPREADVIRRRFGLDGGEPQTLEEVGQAYNLTRERIRQLQAKAMVKLQKSSCKSRLLPLVEEG